ncbi:DUF3883 domain-containing protein [Psychrobacillus sp. FSL H8-0484]|uniref:sacsin N-terminal ATP-binding-like domain-containing protein n=1 Tax=Psychrobacillus sp. FSL H8-0484 TaxID=2921390 RepID=UPI0030FAD656
MEVQSRIDYGYLVADKTARELRSFLAEIKNKTRNYQSVYNLTEQMTQDYANRFIIELLQNGHDAITKSKSGAPGKIKIILKEYKGKSPVLYFANTGDPFTESNFNALSSLALSDKNPSEAVGNKGIGFKSVLQVSKVPQIFSGTFVEGLGFDGYSFEFNPSKVQRLVDDILKILHSPSPPTLEFLTNYDIPIVDWGPDEIQRFRDALHAQMIETKMVDERSFISIALSQISPYQLPFPIHKYEDDILMDLGREGYATVVRLELTEDDALKICVNALKELELDSWIFLNGLEELTIIFEDKDKQTITRHMTKKSKLLLEGPCIFKEIEMEDRDGIAKKYLLVSRSIGGKADPQNQKRILQAATKLHGSWETLDAATIDLAIPLSSEQQKGKIFIYLPTKQPNGFAFHINAPFLGQMNRTQINTSLALNELLLREAAILILASMDYVIENQPPRCENLIADLISFHESDEDIPRIVMEELKQRLKEKSIDLVDWGVFPYQDQKSILCFGSINNVYLLKSDWSNELFSAQNFSQQLGIKLLSGISDDRIKSIEEFGDYLGVQWYPTSSELAEWAERLAKILHSKRVTMCQWQLFYEELVKIFDDSAEDLADYEILLGQDYKLHAGGDTENSLYIFFPPVQGNHYEDVAEIKESSKVNIPSFLQNKIAFIHSDLKLYETEKGVKGRKKNSINDFLRDSGLVQEFQLENILTKVIIPEMPRDGVIPFPTEKSDQLYELLEWTMLLYFGSLSSPDSLKRRFNQLLVPCNGGWYKATETYFSSNWNNYGSVQYGHYLSQYFNEIAKYGYLEGQKKQILDYETIITKFHSHKFTQEDMAQFFEFCGTIDTLRLVPVIETEKIRINGNNTGFYFADKIEGDFSVQQLNWYKDLLSRTKAYYSGNFSYELYPFLTVEGMAGYNSFSKNTRLVFAGLVVASLPKWKNWEKVYLKKLDGQQWRVSFPSLLKLSLSRLSWIPVSKEDEGIFLPPSKVWYIHSSNLRSSGFSYSYLNHVSYEISQLLERTGAISNIKELDLRSFDPATPKEAVELLDELAYLYESEAVKPELINYFKNHYKSTWEHLLEFYDPESTFIDYGPESLIVAQDNHLKAINFNNEEGLTVFIPDDKRRLMELQNNSNLNILFIDHGKKFIEMLIHLYKSNLGRLTNLEQKVYVNAELWDKEKAADCETNFIEDDREWLFPFIMTVVIFREDSGLSINHKRFHEICVELKKLKWQACDHIERSLINMDGEVISTKNEITVYHRETDTILFTRNSTNIFENLAVCIREVLQIAPLELSLKFAFTKFLKNDLEEPAEGVILEALQSLKITQEDYETVKRVVNEDLQWIIEMLLPTTVVLAEDKSATLEAVMNFPLIDSEANLEDYVSKYLSAGVVVSEIVRMAKESNNYKAMGHRVYIKYCVQLEKWNQALVDLGKVNQVVVNDQLYEEFESYKKQFSNTMISVLRYLVNNLLIEFETYLKLKSSYWELNLEPQYTREIWQLKDVHIIRLLKEFLENYGVRNNLLEIFRETKSMQKLNDQLKTVGVNFISYLEIAKHNQNLLKECLKKLQYASILLSKQKGEEVSAYWLLAESTLYAHVTEDRERELFELQEWNVEQTYEFIIESGRIPNDDLVNLRGKGENQISLAIDDILNQNEEIEDVEELIENEKEKQLRKKRLVNIFGQEFDSDESNHKNLGKLVNTLDNNVLSSTGNFDQPMSLKELELPQRNQPSKNSGNKNGGSPSRPGKQIQAMVGRVGELIIYNYLKHHHKDFTPENWVSENSRIEFEEKNANDSLGYDFEIIEGNKTFHIEVKATIGQDNKFEMGSSETSQAKIDAKKKNSEYVIAFITNTFKDPQIYWLPNPYSKEGEKLFSLTDVGVRVKFRK